MDINVCFGLKNEDCQHCACTMASLLYNSNTEDKYTIYLVSDYISERNRERLENLKSIRDFRIEYITFNPDDYKDLKVDEKHAHRIYCRLKAFESLDCDKVLYLDTDMIIRRDIRPLYETDIPDFCCAGIEDIIAPRKIQQMGFPKDMFYINEGVLLLNIGVCKRMDVVKRIKEFFSESWNSSYNDQELINYIFQLNIKPVDIEWNVMPYQNMYADQKHYTEVLSDPSIIHFIEQHKPWLAHEFPPFKNEYFKYLNMTDYYDEFMPGYNCEYQTIMLRELLNLRDMVANSIKR